MFGLSYIAIDRGRNKVGKNLLQRKGIAKRNRGRPGSQWSASGVLVECLRDESHEASGGKPRCAQFAGHNAHGF